MMTGIVLASSDTFPFNHFDSDTDFYFALVDLQSSANFDSSLLGTKYFNPFLEDPATYQFLHNSDLDLPVPTQTLFLTYF